MSTTVTMGDPSEEEPEDDNDQEEEAEEEEEERRPTLEEADDDEVVFPNGPTVGLVKEWKKHFKRVIITSFGIDTHVVWRTLTRPEYKQMALEMERLSQTPGVTQAEATFISEEQVAELCILWPEYHPGDPNEDAGIASTIYQEVMEASGFVPIEIVEL